ncbi:MAG: DNA mismatch repair endonuclease MutL [Chloroflexi bacterium]|nr:DNA mismatch repair endonuclease MutL [Chloroflexota bacterium]
MTIRVLSEETALKIAAGEVIERPASVVKELIENCIDAGAKNIRVEIKNGGLNYLRVADDGCGIPFEEVPLAFERHATSKIDAAEDLYSLTTLGFRGEALPSIAAVSQMTLLTRPRPIEGQPEESGSELAIEGGKKVYHRPAGAPPGTIITVRNLFYNLPARQKWSRSGTSEAGQILNMLSNYALAYPALKFGLVSEGKLQLQTSGNGDLRDAITKVYNLETAQAMLPLQNPPETVDADGVIIEEENQSKIRVTGYTSDPALSKPNRSAMTFFVNRRWVLSRALTYAVQEAYHSLLMTGRYPVCVILVEVDPAEVDANVHPAKTEVRFLHERAVFSAVQKAVRKALVREAATAIFELSRPEATPPAIATTETARPSFLTPPTRNPSSAKIALANQLFAPTDSSDEPEVKADPSELKNQQGRWDMTTGKIAPATNPAPPEQRSTSRSRLPFLRLIGQVSTLYLVAEGPDGMYLIDQHAAHERVMYEQFQAQLAGHNVNSQLLLEPMLLDLTSQQRLALEDPEKSTALAEFGFQLEPFGDETYILRAVPASLFGRDLKTSLTEMLDEAGERRDSGCGPTGSERLLEPDTPLPRTWRDRLAASLACHSAIRAGQILTQEEMRELITRLERTTAPNACAHGRPTLLHLSQGQLEKGFGRR